MYRDLVVAAIVPAYREERHIANVIATMPGCVDHIIVVDDASPDGTSEVAMSMGDDRLNLIRHDSNQGVGGAIVTGHTRALTLGADVAVVMAGDGQMDPDFLPAMLDPIASGAALFTKANRFYRTDSFVGMPRLRVMGNIGLSFLSKAASGYWNLFDPQNGYTAVHRAALERLPLDKLAKRYDFENDMLINLNILRVPAMDVPVPARYGTEVSGLSIGSAGPRIFARLVRGFWHRMLWKYVVQSFSAVALLFFSGLLLFALGLSISLWTLLQTLGPPVATAGTVILSVVPLLSGFQLLLFSMMLDIQESAGLPPTTFTNSSPGASPDP